MSLIKLMNNNEQNKFERLASLFHHEKSDGKKTQNAQQESGITEDSDFSAVKKIYEAKDLVCQASKVTPPGKAWNKVHSRIRRRHPLRNIVYWQYAAAVIVVILTIGLFVGKNVRQYFSDPEQFISIVSPLGLGEIKNLTLTDGTDVWLNSGSILKFSNRFGKTNRHVIVDGEALFKVVKDNKNPFTVSLGNSKVIVHGTTFNVKGYSTDDKYEVVLIEGSVEYVNSLKNIFIEPGERITEIKASGYLVVDRVDPENYTSWKENKLRFYDTPFEEVLREIGRKYNVTFEIKNRDLLNLKYTATFIDESIEEVMQMLKTVSPITYKIINRTSVNDKQYIKPKIIIEKRQTLK